MSRLLHGFLIAMALTVNIGCGANDSYRSGFTRVKKLDNGGQSNDFGRGLAGAEPSVTGVWMLETYNGTLETPLSPAPGVGFHLQCCRDLISLGHIVSSSRITDGADMGDIDKWQPGQSMWNEMVARRTTHDAQLATKYHNLAIDEYFVWIHGETAATNAGLAAAYGAKELAFLDARDALYGPIKTIILGLHANMSGATHKATVNTAKIANAAAKPWRYYRDPTSWSPSEAFADGFHYVTSGYKLIGSQLAQLINTL
jgi:hypothetical protein